LLSCQRPEVAVGCQDSTCRYIVFSIGYLNTRRWMICLVSYKSSVLPLDVFLPTDEHLSSNYYDVIFLNACLFRESRYSKNVQT
ncbi:hypothetical protein PISMIDRAFT_671011, partial [Pisolithus microcarpus 441]